MAVRFDAAADRLLRTANNPTAAGPFTVSFWVRLVTDLNAFSTLWYLGANDYSPATYMWLGLEADGVTLRLYTNNAASATGTVLTVGQWYHIAIVRGAAANRSDVYVDGVLDIQDTRTDGASDRHEFGAVGTSGFDRGDLRISNVLWWSSALSVAEIQQQRQRFVPVTFANLEGWYPLIQAASADFAEDWSGLARNFTVGGTLTSEADPPVSWGGSPVIVGRSAGTSIQSGTWSSSGTGSLATTGRSTSAAAWVATATGALASVGRSTHATVYSASGSGALTAVGRSTHAATWSSSGSGTYTAVGVSTASSTWSATGTGALAGVGRSTSSAVGSASGNGTLTGTGRSTAASAWSASGTSAVSGVGSVAGSLMSLVGVGTLTTIGTSIHTVTWSSAGLGSLGGNGATTDQEEIYPYVGGGYYPA